MHEQPNELPPIFPLDQVLTEMVELLKFAIHNVDKAPLTIDTELAGQLAQLQKDLSALDAAVGFRMVEKEQMEILPQKIQHMLKECEQLKNEMGQKLADLKEKELAGKQDTKQKTETKEEAIERKQKGLRRISRNQKWKQL